jgi:ABC-2 type transport system ATP-binding protein
MKNKTETNEEIAIKVEGVYKDFDLPHEKQNSLKQKIVHPFKSKGTVEKQHALKDISFEVKKGEFFGIVGRNGSGKSTLLKILAEIYTPTKGKVTVNGSLTPFIELGVGFNPELTGRENVYLNGAMLGFSTKEMEKMYDEIVEFAELEKFMDQKLKNYSSGMQVRLAFSVAIRAKSDILLLDEVLAVGDADFQRKCFNYFRTLKKDRSTVILVTHDMNAVREYCDRAILLESSTLKHSGTPEEISVEYIKLFQPKSSSTSSGEKGKRWGDGSLKFENIRVEVGNTLEIYSRIRAHKQVDDPIIGIRIKNAAGVPLIGTNNKIKKIKIDSLKKGEVRTIKWSLDNVLTQGSYYFDTSALYADGLTTRDSWEDAAIFEVTKEEITPYPITPNINLSTE